jgi:long-chain acyl-CoA synthetase
VGRPVAGMEVTIADDREILPRVYCGSLAELAAGPQVLAEAASGVADDDERLARVQQVEYWYLLPMGWTAETDELATTLKLERRVVHASWAVVTDSLYGCE